jgi:hypothetical protein
VRLPGHVGGTRVYSLKAKAAVVRGARRGGQVANTKRKVKYGVVSFLAAARRQG